MNCRECQDLIIIRIYGGLEPAEEEALQMHVQDCHECGRMYSRLAGHSSILAGKEPQALPDWEDSWRTIQEGAFPEKKAKHFRLAVPKPVWVAASLVTVFILGALVGRQLLLRPAPTAAPETAALQTSGIALARLADDLDPILTGFMNRTAEAEADEASRIAQIEALLIQDMLIQARLLKHLLDQTDDPSLLEFLDDLEFILVSMANLQSGDQESLGNLQEIIREKDLKFKLKTFSRSESIL